MTVSVAVGLPPNLKGVKASEAALVTAVSSYQERKEQMERYPGIQGLCLQGRAL